MSNIFLNAPGHGQEMIQFGIMEEHKTPFGRKTSSALNDKWP